MQTRYADKIHELYTVTGEGKQRQDSQTQDWTLSEGEYNHHELKEA